MKKLMPLILFIFLVQQGFAQNWQCVRSGAKSYFTNNIGYLRGVRIDSTKLTGGDSILFPFRSPRGPYKNQQLDTNGGSWLGKTITIKPDGTHYFDNYWGDTVIIKSKANLNDSWILFNDTTNTYYTATVTAMDTMTINNAADSIKRITINAFKGFSPISNDPLNGVDIIISKNNGFVQVFDLHMFPLHKPDTAYGRGFDYFLDESNDMNGTLGKNNITFRKVNFIDPTTINLYNFQLGDMFQSVYVVAGTAAGYTITTLDKIVNLSPLTSYSISETSATGYHQTTTGNVLYNIPSFGSKPDLTFMPEETGQANFYYYKASDTSFCTMSPEWTMVYNGITDTAYVSASVTKKTVYKSGFGLVSYTYLINAASENYTLLYYSSLAAPCGTPLPMSIHELDKDKISIYPNPATDEIQVQLSPTTNYALSIINLTGQVVKQTNTNNGKATIHVSDLPNGIYILSAQNSDGDITHQRFVVSH